MVKHQRWCRFLQERFEGVNPDEDDMIFHGVISHVVEFMVDTYGNFLMQKVMEVCREDQWMRILRVLVKDPTNFIRICLDKHGTRAVQKLIGIVHTREQVSLFMMALKTGVLELMLDLNGSHVIRCCMKTFGPQDNKFIYDTATMCCIEIATHQYGCCLLQYCITHSTVIQHEKLVSELVFNGLFLAQNCYGNYVIQYILELKIQAVISTIIPQFRGNYVNLSTQKYSSNVVQKCLKTFGEKDCSSIINELVSFPSFDQLIQDPYTNYVIQTAFIVSRGSLHSLVTKTSHRISQ
ncbi:hypothetical protein QJS04_geneDACA022773 [Acorus gramineus]|uniref:PUM-HD domain-containing protein n=1 Tax=Acorus gramineus TaxID=55184 RepID=A0AAV9AYK0_ACOGR|nr:hypothetical protein QJS04_geneDACA022773 [Acorus gramineus]